MLDGFGFAYTTLGYDCAKKKVRHKFSGGCGLERRKVADDDGFNEEFDDVDTVASDRGFKMAAFPLLPLDLFELLLFERRPREPRWAPLGVSAAPTAPRDDDSK